MAQMKGQIKAPKIELSDEEIANISDAEFKTLVIRMLTEMVEYGHKIEERVKVMKSEWKENAQGAKSDGKETGTQINGVGQKKVKKIQWEQNEETRIQKNEERHRNLQDNFKRSNTWITGVPEEEENQEIENLLDQIMKNFPNLAKEIDFQEVQEAQRVPKKLNKLDPRRNTPRHIIIKLPKIKDKQRILKAAREKQRVTYKGVPSHKTTSWFLKRNFAGKKGLERIIWSHERQGPTSKITLSSKAII